MSIASTLPSSTTSPVRISFEAPSTASGVTRLAAPRSSAAPHLDGQRASGAGGAQLCATAPASCRIVTADRHAIRLALVMLSPSIRCYVERIRLSKCQSFKAMLVCEHVDPVTTNLLYPLQTPSDVLHRQLGRIFCKLRVHTPQRFFTADEFQHGID